MLVLRRRLDGDDQAQLLFGAGETGVALAGVLLAEPAPASFLESLPCDDEEGAFEEKGETTDKLDRLRLCLCEDEWCEVEVGLFPLPAVVMAVGSVVFEGAIPFQSK